MSGTLDKIKPKVIVKKMPFKEKRSITVSGLNPSTHAFMEAEAKARNMGLSEFGKAIFELLETGDL